MKKLPLKFPAYAVLAFLLTVAILCVSGAGPETAVDLPHAARSGPIASAQLTHNRININKATAATLSMLPGIGNVLSQRIVQFRTEHGPFASVAELCQVNGIGEKLLESIRDYITIGG